MQPALYPFLLNSGLIFNFQTKKSTHTTAEFDGFSSRRQKGTCAGLMVLNEDGNKTSYYPIACERSAGSTATASAEWLRSKLEYMATISAEGTSTEELLESAKELTEKVKFFITDDG